MLEGERTVSRKVPQPLVLSGNLTSLSQSWLSVDLHHFLMFSQKVERLLRV